MLNFIQMITRCSCEDHLVYTTKTRTDLKTQFTKLYHYDGKVISEMCLWNVDV